MEETKIIAAVNTAAVSPTSIQVTSTIQVGAELTIEAFGMVFSGVIEKTDDGTRLLVSPGGKTFSQTATLDNVLKSCDVDEKSIASLDSVLKYVGITSKDFVIAINTAFYYYSTYAADLPDDTHKTEYAFSIAVNNTSDPTDAPFKIDSVGVSIWNSTRPGIINSMGLVNIGDKLKALSS
jgi:hypothetical protein